VVIDGFRCSGFGLEAGMGAHVGLRDRSFGIDIISVRAGYPQAMLLPRCLDVDLLELVGD
jgi:hypothetical protein